MSLRLTFIWCALFMGIGNAQAAGPEEGTKSAAYPLTAGEPRVDAESIWSKDSRLPIYLSGGIGTYYEASGSWGLKGAMDFMLTERISIGAQADLFFAEGSVKSERTPFLGPRVAYHLLVPGNKTGNKPWNLFLAASGDFYFGKGDDELSEITFLPDVMLGARYRIAKSWFVQAEVGARTATVGLSLEL